MNDPKHKADTESRLPTTSNPASNGEARSTSFENSAQEVISRVEQMLSCFRPQQGVDPQEWAKAIVGILLHYPIEVTREVCNPFSGLPSKQEFMPSPYDVKQAAEAYMRPLREKRDRDARIKAQLEERQAIEDQRARPERKQTMEEIEDEMHERGLDMPGWIERQKRVRDEKLRAEMSAKYGKAYDDLPEGIASKPPEEVKPRRLITWKERETEFKHLPPYNPGWHDRG